MQLRCENQRLPKNTVPPRCTKGYSTHLSHELCNTASDCEKVNVLLCITPNHLNGCGWNSFVPNLHLLSAWINVTTLMSRSRSCMKTKRKDQITQNDCSQYWHHSSTVYLIACIMCYTLEPNDFSIGWCQWFLLNDNSKPFINLGSRLLLKAHEADNYYYCTHSACIAAQKCLYIKMY